MYKAIRMHDPEVSILKNPEVIKEICFLSIAAILLSVGIIWFHNRILFNEEIYSIYSQIELAGITFMPYMIAGAIAALTALYLTHYIPEMKSKVSSHLLAMRIQKLGQGDLVSFTRIQSHNQEINDIARELSFTVAQWNSQMSQMKIINRQQWDLLQEIKHATLREDKETVLLHLQKIETNWIKTAEIEELIKT